VDNLFCKLRGQKNTVFFGGGENRKGAAVRITINPKENQISFGCLGRRHVGEDRDTQGGRVAMGGGEKKEVS